MGTILFLNYQDLCRCSLRRPFIKPGPRPIWFELKSRIAAFRLGYISNGLASALVTTVTEGARELKNESNERRIACS